MCNISRSIHPISDRIISVTLRGKLPNTFIITYMPQAERPEEEKEETYEALEREFIRHKNKGPTFVIGDMNARIMKAKTNSEELVIGKQRELTACPHKLI